MKVKLTFIALLIASAVSAHNFTINKGNFKHNAGLGKSAMISMTATTGDSLYYQIQTAGDSSFTVLPGFTATVGGKFTSINRTITIPDSALSWARIISWDSLGNRDTTTPVKMYRMPEVYATAYSSMTKIWSSVTVDNGNDSVMVKFILGYDSTFSSTNLYRTQLVTGNTSVTFSDTIPYTLAPATYYWIKYIVPNVLGSDTFILKKQTLSNLKLPYVAIDGPITSTNTTITLQTKVDGYGYATTAMGFIKKKGMTLYQDSVSLPVAQMLGKQNLVFTYTGLTAVTDYVMDVRVRNSGGDNWMGQVTYQTDYNPPTHYYRKDSVSANDSSIYARYLYSNVPNEVCDLTIVCAYGTIGNTINSVAFHNLQYTGTKEVTFSISQTGDYYVYAYGPAFPSGNIAYGDTVHMKVTPTGVSVVRNEKQLQVYPNPATNFIFINAENYSLIDISGKQVQKGTVPESSQVYIGDLPKGMYILKAGDEYEKLLIQ